MIVEKIYVLAQGRQTQLFNGSYKQPKNSAKLEINCFLKSTLK